MCSQKLGQAIARSTGLCRLAKNRELKALSYDCCSTRNIKSDPLVLSYFINLPVDTIWLYKLYDIHNRLTFYDRKLSSNHTILDSNGSLGCPPNVRLNSLAIDIETWASPGVKADGNIFDGTVDLLQQVHPQELLIVVAGPSVLRPSKILLSNHQTSLTKWMLLKSLM
jgi:hypothetical protein